MRKLSRLAILVLLTAFSTLLKAQDPQFSQFYANQVLLSPAFTGASEGPRVALNYRSQWAAIPNGYKTFAASVDMPVFFGPTRHGLGISVLGDMAGNGPLTKYNILFNYAYRFLINDNHALRFGLSAGIYQAGIDYYSLVFPNQLYPQWKPGAQLLPSGENGLTSRINEDVNFGVMYHNNFMWAGVTLNHLTQPKEIFVATGSGGGGQASLPLKVSVFAGAMIPFTKDKLSSRSISPSIMFRHQGPFNQLDLGCYVNFDPIIFGLYFRAFQPDAVIGLIGVKKGMFRIGYSYDYTVSSLTNGISGGSHEVSLVFEFDKPLKQRRSPKVNMNCPKF